MNRSEIAHPSIRGTVTALQQFMLGIGSFVAGWVSYGTYIGLHSTAQWRLPLGLQMLPAIGLGIITQASSSFESTTNQLRSGTYIPLSRESTVRQ
jgi:MFS family permease